MPEGERQPQRYRTDGTHDSRSFAATGAPHSDGGLANLTGTGTPDDESPAASKDYPGGNACETSLSGAPVVAELRF